MHKMVVVAKGAKKRRNKALLKINAHDIPSFTEIEYLVERQKLAAIADRKSDTTAAIKKETKGAYKLLEHKDFDVYLKVTK